MSEDGQSFDLAGCNGQMHAHCSEDDYDDNWCRCSSCSGVSRVEFRRGVFVFKFATRGRLVSDFGLKNS